MFLFEYCLLAACFALKCKSAISADDRLYNCACFMTRTLFADLCIDLVARTDSTTSLANFV